jgi:hypothetical protein
MPEYDAANFNPPAPVVKAALRSLESRAVVREVELLLDSGADITLLPQTAVAQLGVTADSGKRYELMGFNGSRSFANGVIIDVLVFGKAFRGLYLLTEDTRGVVGRDVLNHLAVILDGPASRWSIVGEQA